MKTAKVKAGKVVVRWRKCDHCSINFKTWEIKDNIRVKDALEDIDALPIGS